MFLSMCRTKQLERLQEMAKREHHDNQVLKRSMHDQKMLAVLKNLVGACLSAVFVSWKVETAKRRVRHSQIDHAILSHVSIGNRQNLRRILQGWWQRTRLGLDEGRKVHKIRKLIHYHVFNECLKMWWEHVLLSRVGRVMMMIGRILSKHDDLVING